MKPKQRKTEEQLIKMGVRIRKRYEYMDGLTLEGWMWEFMRRSKKYKSLLAECIQCYQDVSDESSSKFFFEWTEKFREIGLDVFFERGAHRESCYHILRFIYSKKHTNTEYLALPKINGRYNKFNENTLPPITGSTTVKTIKYETIQRWLRSYENEHGGFDSDTVKMFLNWLIPLKNKNSMLLGIPTVCKIDDLREEIELLIQKHVKSRKTKDVSSKWKYYLIAYDLYYRNLKEKRYTDTNIATILQAAYPEVVKAAKNTETPQNASSRFDEENCEIFFNDRNITNYRKGAFSLIDKGTYKKYLYI